MKPGFAADSATQLRQRWDRLGLGIRCAYNPGQPAVVRQYLALGTQLARMGLLPELVASQRMLQLLLQTAHDEALPWFWRSVCLEHTVLPASQLISLLKLHDPLAAQAVHAMVQAAQDRLAAAAPAPRSPRADGSAA